MTVFSLLLGLIYVFRRGIVVSRRLNIFIHGPLYCRIMLNVFNINIININREERFITKYDYNTLIDNDDGSIKKYCLANH